MSIYGYARISTARQSLTRQVKNILAAYPAAEIITETFTGRTTRRPEWCKLKAKALKQAARGEATTIIFDEISRMSRNADEGIEEYKQLYAAGVNLVFLKDSGCNTAVYQQAAQQALTIPTDGQSKEISSFLQALETAVNTLIESLAAAAIRAAFERSQAEVDYLRQRTKEGIQASSKQAGRPKGKAAKPSRIAAEITEAIQKHHRDMHGGQGLTDGEIIEMIRGRHGGKGCSRNTYYRCKKMIFE